MYTGLSCPDNMADAGILRATVTRVHDGRTAQLEMYEDGRVDVVTRGLRLRGRTGPCYDVGLLDSGQTNIFYMSDFPIAVRFAEQTLPGESPIEAFVQRAMDLGDAVDIRIMGPGERDMHWATLVGDVELVHALADAGHDATDPHFIVSAADGGLHDVVHALIDEGADVDADSDGFTPLGSAISRGKLECANVLLQNGARIDADDQSNPLGEALQENCRDMVDLLMSSGADMSEEERPLPHCYCRCGIEIHCDSNGEPVEAHRNRVCRDGYGKCAVLETIDSEWLLDEWADNAHPRQLELRAALDVLTDPAVFDEIQLAYICGDYIMLTPERRRHYEREKRAERDARNAARRSCKRERDE